MAKSFTHLAQRTMSTKARARASARANQLLAEMALAEIRKLTGKSQAQVARTLGIKQPSLSKLENQDDMQVSTLKKIIEALGGEIRITAQFKDREIPLKQFHLHPQPTRKTREFQTH